MIFRAVLSPLPARLAYHHQPSCLITRCILPGITPVSVLLPSVGRSRAAAPLVVLAWAQLPLCMFFVAYAAHDLGS